MPVLECADGRSSFEDGLRDLGVVEADVAAGTPSPTFGHSSATLEAIANGHPQARIDDLLPWNFQPSSLAA